MPWSDWLPGWAWLVLMLAALALALLSRHQRLKSKARCEQVKADQNRDAEQ